MSVERSVESMTVDSKYFALNGQRTLFRILRGYAESKLNELALYRQDGVRGTQPQGWVLKSDFKSETEAWTWLKQQGYEEQS